MFDQCVERLGELVELKLQLGYIDSLGLGDVNAALEKLELLFNGGVGSAKLVVAHLEFCQGTTILLDNCQGFRVAGLPVIVVGSGIYQDEYTIQPRYSHVNDKVFLKHDIFCVWYWSVQSWHGATLGDVEAVEQCAYLVWRPGDVFGVERRR